MTTIIVVSIVALVYFVTLSVVAFMVWKRESEMRTDSIKAIEHGINDMAYELADISLVNKRRVKMMCREEERHDDRSNINKNKNNVSLDYIRMKDKNDVEETITVFRPAEGQNKKLKWTEVSEEPVSMVKEPETVPAEPVIVQESGPGDQHSDHVKCDTDLESVPKAEISLSFIDLEDLDKWNDVDLFEGNDKVHTDYDTGRSGRKYTAEELESLIKE